MVYLSNVFVVESLGFITLTQVTCGYVPDVFLTSFPLVETSLSPKKSLVNKTSPVSEGHMTEPPKDSVYSGVVLLGSMRLALLIVEINGLKTLVGDHEGSSQIH